MTVYISNAYVNSCMHVTAFSSIMDMFVNFVCFVLSNDTWSQ